MSAEDLVLRYKQKTAAVEDMPQQQEHREIPKDHPYDPKSLKPLAKALWAASVAMGHALTSYRHLARLKSATISPDGKLGGKGYVMSVSDMRKRLYEACESLSTITDTLHDEVCAPHWKPRLAQLDENEAEDIERFVEESQGNIDNPEEDAQENEKEIEEENDSPKGKGKKKEANSSIPVGALPGPRVEHLDRELDLFVEDWADPKEYVYRNPGVDNKQAASAFPDSATDDTPTEAWDFGLGYGAKGQGAGGYANPAGGGKGVWGPASGLPGSPSQSVGDTNAVVERYQNEKKARYLTESEVIARAEREFARKGLPKNPTNAQIIEAFASDLEKTDQLAQSGLPGSEEPVARSDYYKGDRGNLVNTVSAWVEDTHAQSNLPGEAPAGGTFAPSLVNTDYTYEDLSTPYVRYDYTTRDYRKDPLHDWPQGKENG